MTSPHQPPTPLTNHNANPVLSSSPAFATPTHPILSKPPAQLARGDSLTENAPFTRPQTRPASVLPILLPPQTLRPIAFRTFTKKHNLTLTASALSSLAAFIGKHCGSGWREEGLAEAVLEEVARQWKKGEGSVIVDAEKDSARLKDILKTVEGGMVGGRVNAGANVSALSRESTSTGGGVLERMISESRPNVARNESQDSIGMSALDVEEEDEDCEGSKEVRGWVKVVSAFEQPRLTYNASRKHFEKSKIQPSFLPGANERTQAFRQRYCLIQQRILRNESFQTPTTTTTSSGAQQWRLTPIANLLGRSGSTHVLLGMLAVTPTGTLALNDLTGSIQVDLDQAAPIDEAETWLCPGMIVLLEGVYEEDPGIAGESLAGQGGVGGTLGGRFIGFSIGAPKAETRAQSLGMSDPNGTADAGHAAGGFGWVDFLGVGSERAVGSRMRRLEQRLLTTPLRDHGAALSATANLDSAAGKVIILGCVALDEPQTLLALRTLFSAYTASATQLLSTSSNSITPASTLPTGFVLFGPFLSQPALAPCSASSSDSTNNSRAYKDAFDAFASLLHEFPLLLRHCTFVFVPSDGDPWASAFGAGAAVPLPQAAVPEMFTTRVRREFAVANGDSTARAKETRAVDGPKQQEHVPGTAVFTSNPARVSLFGPQCEIVLFRDDATGRLRRNSVVYGKGRGAVSVQEGETDSGVEMMSSPPESGAAGEETEEAMDVDGPPRRMPEQKLQPPTIDPVTAHGRRLTKTLLDQSYLAPYPVSIQPIHWSYANSLSLYPLPSAMVLCDPDAAAFGLVYQGCAVVNAGKLVGPLEGRGKPGVRWCEFDLKSRRGVVRTQAL